MIVVSLLCLLSVVYWFNGDTIALICEVIVCCLAGVSSLSGVVVFLFGLG